MVPTGPEEILLESYQECKGKTLLWSYSLVSYWRGERITLKGKLPSLTDDFGCCYLR